MYKILMMMNKDLNIFYPSLQQKPHSQIRSPKNSQATVSIFLFVIVLINYSSYLRRVKVILCKIIKTIKNKTID
jgi:uncharacterized membrane protein required for colicin V production